MAVAPPRPKMPPLNALKAFEAAARLNSFSAAAEELCVTPAAVAQQIKTLEAGSGKKLFKRHAKGVQLTPLGAAVLPGLIVAFDALAASVHTLRNLANPHEVRIAATPSIAQLWISPRLPGLRCALPDLSLSITAMETPPNLSREPFDLAIFYRTGPLSAEDLVIGPDIIFPVCAPEVAEQLGAPDDLAGQTLLYDSTWKSDWDTWLSAAASEANVSKAGPEFSLYSLALEECRNGAGVLIGHDLLVRSELDRGTLTAPFSATVTLPAALTIRPATPLQPGSPLQQAVDFLLAYQP